MLALLFDEFSFAYLYDGAAIRPEFPRLRAFATEATSYLNARSPGRDTMTSVPGFLTGQVFDEVHPDGHHLRYVQGREGGHVDAASPEGLLETARRAGLSPDVVGYYFAYCELVGAAADSCRSFSFYNVSTVRRTFSPVHPLLTTIILWPRQFPLGILKSRAFGWHQRDLVNATALELARALDPAHPVFRLVHFSIPHLPFVYGERGFDPPADALRQRPDDGYARQLRYADALFGTVVDRLRRERSYDETTIVFLSDHGHRSSGRDTDPRHIPFLVKAAGQSQARQVSEPLAGERLLHDIVAQACTPGLQGGTSGPATGPARPDRP